MEMYSSNFMIGLSNPLDYQVRCERPHSLSEAIRLAVEFECKQAARRSNAYSVSSATKLQSTPAIVQMLESSTNATAIINDSHNLNAESAQILRAELAAVNKKASCSYCQKQGHTVDVCRQKQFSSLKCEYCLRKGHVLADCLTLRSHIRSEKIQNPNDKGSSSNTNNNYNRYERNKHNYTNRSRWDTRDYKNRQNFLSRMQNHRDPDNQITRSSDDAREMNIAAPITSLDPTAPSFQSNHLN